MIACECVLKSTEMGSLALPLVEEGGERVRF